jgi:cytochrome c oxidase subunit 2
MSLSRAWALLVSLPAMLMAIAAPALADHPQPWEMGFQAPATPVMERIEDFHTLLLVVITLISAFVLALLAYIIFRFNERRNPSPSRTSHNTTVEVVWTVVPVLILVMIAIPSFRLLYFADRTQDAEMTIKAIGHQWYWSYEYPDNGNFTFDAMMVPENEIKDGQMRLLETDNVVVLPIETNIRLLTNSQDVIHSWAMPSFGVKLDANPGQVNETWMRITKEGTYYGQCSEICGVGHAYMPIKIEAVSKEKFQAWVTEAQQKFARVDAPAPQVAAAAE